jgi:hypothetical protein
MTQGRVAQIVSNTNFGEINTLLSQGHDMDYIAEHYHMDLALAWALRLEGKQNKGDVYTLDKQSKFVKSVGLTLVFS